MQGEDQRIRVQLASNRPREVVTEDGERILTEFEGPGPITWRED